MINTFFLFFKKKGGGARIWDNVAKYGSAGQATDDSIIRRMRNACWITKAKNTDTHSEYVIFIALALLKRLRERALTLPLHVHGLYFLPVHLGILATVYYSNQIQFTCFACLYKVLQTNLAYTRWCHLQSRFTDWLSIWYCPILQMAWNGLLSKMTSLQAGWFTCIRTWPVFSSRALGYSS